MKYLLIIIMAMAAVMITLYFIALCTKSNRWLIAFRVTLLILILTLIISWIVSIVLGQQFILLLGLAVIFILLYVYS